MFVPKSKKEKQEAIIKANLNDRLKESVQSVIQHPERYSDTSDAMGHSDNVNVFCNVLEAIFIHGLRHSLGDRMSQLFLEDPDRMPVPNFWPVLLIITHRNLIEQVNNLSFITSEVGKARSWIRCVLNEGQLLSYLSVLSQDKRTLKDYYKPFAFLRDFECCDIMLRILQPISSVYFQLATNAAVLNTWTQTPLILSGLWIPSSIYDVISQPLLSATDVASTVFLEEESSAPYSIPHSSEHLDDHMFDIIIGGTPETSFIKEKFFSENDENVSDAECDENKQQEAEQIHSPSKVCITPTCENENALSKKLCRQSKTSTRDGEITPHKHSLTHEISEDGSSLAQSVIHTEYENLFSQLESEGNFVMPGFLANNCTSPSVESPEFNLPADFSDSLIPLLTRLTQEEGLDAQDYQCNLCKSPIGMIYGKPKMCYYDSKYYCHECHVDEMSIIPARIIHNCDFTPYPVSSRNAEWLKSVCYFPVVNLRLVGPKLYMHMEILNEIKDMRIQLSYVKAYLFTCRTNIGSKLGKMLWPKDYLYEHVHIYSVDDLLAIESGSLHKKIYDALIWGKNHIYSCQVCSARGFICEICSNAEIIYPFMLEYTYTCQVCFAVYHRTCFGRKSACPRCLRRKERRKNESKMNEL